MASAMDTTTASPSPPPVIGKIGPYTVFLTPPPTSPIRTTAADPISEAPKKVAPQQPSKLPPVRPPPAQFAKPSARHHDLGFLHNAVSRLQTAHSSLDEYVANWLGLNQSKYQWALDDYHEAKGLEKADAKTKEMSSRSQFV